MLMLSVSKRKLTVEREGTIEIGENLDLDFRHCK